MKCINLKKNIEVGYERKFGYRRGRRRGQSGVTLAELVITVAIFTLVAVGVTLFLRDIFSFNTYIQGDLTSQVEGRRAVERIVAELREAAPSSLGSYPIAAAATSSITFYSDIDSDDVQEQVRYYVQSQRLMKSVINPSGNPLVYNSGSAIVTTVVSNIANAPTAPLFQYYDTNYAGTTTPLSTPINISSVKLVKIDMSVNSQTSRGPHISNFTSQVTLRNLKDNL